MGKVTITIGFLLGLMTLSGSCSNSSKITDNKVGQDIHMGVAQLQHEDVKQPLENVVLHQVELQQGIQVGYLNPWSTRPWRAKLSLDEQKVSSVFQNFLQDGWDREHLNATVKSVELKKVKSDGKKTWMLIANTNEYKDDKNVPMIMGFEVRKQGNRLFLDTTAYVNACYPDGCDECGFKAWGDGIGCFCRSGGRCNHSVAAVQYGAHPLLAAFWETFLESRKKGK